MRGFVHHFLIVKFCLYRDLLFAVVQISVRLSAILGNTDYKHVLLIFCDIFNSIFLISNTIIHQSMLYELLSNLSGSLLLYYDFILH